MSLNSQPVIPVRKRISNGVIFGKGGKELKNGHSRKFYFAIVLLYLLVGVVWTKFADIFLEHWIASYKQLAVLHVYKSEIFIFFSAILLYWAVRREFKGRERAEEALKDSHEKGGILFERNPHPMWIIDLETLNFLSANDAAVMRYGYSRDEFLSMTLKDMTPAEDITPLLTHISKSSGGIDEAGTWRHLKRDGGIVFVRIIISEMRLEGRKTGLIMAQDVSEQKITEERIQQQLNAITAIYAGSQRLTESLDINEISKNIVRTCVEAFGCGFAWLGKAEAGGGMSLLACYPADTEPLQHIQVRWDESSLGNGPIGRSIRSAKPVVIDIKEDAGFIPWRDAALSAGFSSNAAFPIISRDNTLGAISLFVDKPGFFNEEVIKSLQAFMHQSASALDNAGLFTETEKRFHHLHALRSIDRAISGSLDLRVTLDVLLEEIVSQLKVDAAAVLLLDLSTNILKYSAGRGFKSSFPPKDIAFRFGEGYAGKVVVFDSGDVHNRNHAEGRGRHSSV